MPRKATPKKDPEAIQASADLCLCGEAPAVCKVGRRWVVACVNTACPCAGYGAGSTWQDAVRAYNSSLSDGRVRK